MSEYDDLIPPEKPPDEAAEEGNPPVPAAQANVDSPASTDDQPTPTDEDARAAGVSVSDDPDQPWLDDPTKTLVGTGIHSYAIMLKRMKAGLPAHTTTLTRDEYVEREVAITKAQMDKGLIKTNPIVDG